MLLVLADTIVRWLLEPRFKDWRRVCRLDISPRCYRKLKMLVRVGGKVSCNTASATVVLRVGDLLRPKSD